MSDRGTVTNQIAEASISDRMVIIEGHSCSRSDGAAKMIEDYYEEDEDF